MYDATEVKIGTVVRMPHSGSKTIHYDRTHSRIIKPLSKVDTLAFRLVTVARERVKLCCFTLKNTL